VRDQALAGLVADGPFALLLRCSFFEFERTDELGNRASGRREVEIDGCPREYLEVMAPAGLPG